MKGPSTFFFLSLYMDIFYFKACRSGLLITNAFVALTILQSSVNRINTMYVYIEVIDQLPFVE